MQVKNSYFYFKSALTPRMCDEIIRYGRQHDTQMAITGGSDDEKNKMLGADLIILDALRIKPHLSHFNLSQAISVINELQPKRALFTHISHYMGLHDEINKTLPNNINLSYDGQIVFL